MNTHRKFGSQLRAKFNIQFAQIFEQNSYFGINGLVSKGVVHKLRYASVGMGEGFCDT